VDKAIQNNIENQIKNKVIELSKESGNNASSITSNEIISNGGYLDSAGIIELVLWIENYFKIQINDEDINIENLGSIDSIKAYVLKIKKN